MKKKRVGRAFGALMALTLATATMLSVTASAANADTTGATATKTCPGAVSPAFFTLGSVVPCNIGFVNTGTTDATVVAMTEQAPWPGGPTVTVPNCQTVSSTIPVGGVLPPNTPCNTTTLVTIPNDPALCNTVFTDRAEIDLKYANGLVAGAFATGTIAVVCPPSIKVTKTADKLSKPTDPVNYTVTICNTGLIPVNKDSVSDTLVGDISSAFPATLAPGACAANSYSRVVLDSDPNPLVNTVTATYDGAGMTATGSASASTDLFYPSVKVTKDCGPNPIEVGEAEVCQIHITNTSTGTTPPALNPASISDSLNGDLLAANPAVTSSTCGGALAAGVTCEIDTTRVVLDTDPNPLVNTVDVLYHPAGFPNDIKGTAQANVTIVTPGISLSIKADEESKPTDPITYTITLCNTGNESVNRVGVTSTILGDETGLFPTVLAAGACDTETVTRTTLASDPNPLVVSVTANYSGLIQTVSATASASTNLFYPSIAVSKNCTPNPLTVGGVEVCVIDITNTTTGLTPPDLHNAQISDSLSGDLLAAGNTAVTSSTCSDTLAVGATCEITTARTVLATDPNPLVNKVTATYNPVGFPNVITNSAQFSAPILTQHQECTLGFWKQSQHFIFWGSPYTPTTLWKSVFSPITTVNQGTYKGQGPATLTLLSALQAGGGGVNSFARHAVAELLNSKLAQPDESTAQVIAEVNAAIAGGAAQMQALADKYDIQQNADNCTGFPVNK